MSLFETDNVQSEWKDLVKLYKENDIPQQSLELLLMSRPNIQKKEKVRIRLENLFEPIHDGNKLSRRILLVGSGGSGKTRLSNEIAYNWAEGVTLFSNFPSECSLVVLYHLKDHLAAENLETELFQLCHKHYSPNEKSEKLTRAILCSLEEKLLLILDGYDTLDLVERNQVKRLLKPCTNSLFSRASFLVTTRETDDTVLWDLFDRVVYVSSSNIHQQKVRDPEITSKKVNSHQQKGECNLPYNVTSTQNDGINNNFECSLKNTAVNWKENMEQDCDSSYSSWSSSTDSGKWNQYETDSAPGMSIKPEKQLLTAIKGSNGLDGRTALDHVSIIVSKAREQDSELSSQTPPVIALLIIIMCLEPSFKRTVLEHFPDSLPLLFAFWFLWTTTNGSHAIFNLKVLFTDLPMEEFIHNLKLGLKSLEEQDTNKNDFIKFLKNLVHHFEDEDSFLILSFLEYSKSTEIDFSSRKLESLAKELVRGDLRRMFQQPELQRFAEKNYDVIVRCGICLPLTWCNGVTWHLPFYDEYTQTVINTELRKLEGGRNWNILTSCLMKIIEVLKDRGQWSDQTNIVTLHTVDIDHSQEVLSRRHFKTWHKLRKFYKTRYGFVHPLGADKSICLDIEDMYIRDSVNDCKTKRTVKVADIFDPEDESGRLPIRVLVVGGKGAGKSLLCQSMAFAWSHGRTTIRAFPSGIVVPVLFHLGQLRLHKSSLEDELIRFLKDKYTAVNPDLQSTAEVIKKLGRNLLLILDGYTDDDIEIHDSVKSFLKDENSKFAGASILVTARPTNDNDFLNLFSKHFSIDALSKETAEKMVTRNLEIFAAGHVGPCSHQDEFLSL